MSSAALVPTLTPGLVRGRSLVSDVLLVSTGVLVLALAAQVVIPLPFTPVPITGQTFAVLVLGGAFGSGRGVVTTAVYLAIGVLGVPVFADGGAGAGVIFGATGGYLVGMLVAAAAVGAAADRGWDRRLSSSLVAMLVGTVVIYAVGATWLALSLGLDVASAIAVGVTPFVVGDLLKIALAGALLPVAWGAAARFGRRP